MKREWKMHRLGDIVYQDINSAEVVQSDKEYEMVGVYSYGKGLFDKEKILGINTSYKTFYKLKNGHIVFSQLFGWEGAIALCTKEFQGKYVSSQFPTFLVNETIADKNFIYYFLQLPKTWKILFETGTGMGSRRRTLNPSNLLNLEIPLPPLSEQKRIVAKIESIKSKIEAIRRLRAEQEMEVRNLHFSIYSEFEKISPNIKLQELLTFSDNWEKPISGKIYRQMGIRIWGQGPYERESIDGGQTKYQKLMKVEENDLVINKIWVRNGALSIVPKNLDGCYVSTEFPTFKYDNSTLNSKWLEFIIKQKRFWEKCAEKSFGTSGKNRIRPEEFLDVEIPLPPLEEQYRVVSILDKVNRMLEIHKQQEKEREELLPGLLDEAFKGEL